MGAVFAEEIIGIANPEVRLLSIGEEPEKGSLMVLEAHELLAASSLNFGGNTEGRDLLVGAADVVVTDGFTGNVVLKLLEGTISNLLETFREEITATATGKLGGLLIRPAAGACATGSIPTPTAADTSSGSAGSPSSPTGTPPAGRSRTRSGWPRGASSTTSSAGWPSGWVRAC